MKSKVVWTYVILAAIFLVSLNALLFTDKIRRELSCNIGYNRQVIDSERANFDLYKKAYDSQNQLTRDFYNVLKPALSPVPNAKPMTPEEQAKSLKEFNDLFNRHFTRLTEIDKGFLGNKLPDKSQC